MKNIPLKNKTILFSKPAITGSEIKYIKESLLSGKLSGDHDWTKKCNSWLEKNTKTKKAFLTTSCTHALEMSALLLDLKEGDEVIMPSFTFPSTANAFVLRGAKIRFIDIRPDTMNMDEKLIESAVRRKTKAIVPVHYAGVACEMNTILNIAKKYNLYVIEDAAQGFMSTYKNNFLGTIGHIGTFSFHETKSITCGEGGAILINDEKFIQRAEIIREKGTNRSSFFRGEIDKYGWVDVGSSYLPSELNAAFLFAQFESAEKILKERLSLWNVYYQNLKPLENARHIELPVIPKECSNNAHMFYIKVKDLDERTQLIKFLKKNNIYALFHFVPLHSSKAGKKFGAMVGKDNFTTRESERLIRLPLYYGLSKDDICFVVDKIKEFYGKR